MRKFKLFCLLLSIVFGVSSCEKVQFSEYSDQTLDHLKSANVISPKIKIAVISDIHYMHPDLLPADLEESPTLMGKLGMDRKLVELSDPILRQVVSDLIIEKPDILLIPGDLAAEGELISHQVVEGLLQDLENAGIQVYVVPGNNDILNPNAFSYATEPPEPVVNIDGDQFVEIYGGFGYEEALYRDENSLSYICEPCNNLWILGIDANLYTPDGDGVEVSGEIAPATLDWIKEKLEEAHENNIKVLAIMHYGILEHYTGQNNLESLISNAQEGAIALANAGLKLIFTGHYHANDIVQFTCDGNTLYDIQTGSLVTPPIPYRIMELDDNFINIDTRRVTEIDAEIPGDMDFLEYCKVNITERTVSMYYFYLRYLFGLDKEVATVLAPYVADAFMAYSAGDEWMPPSVRKELDAFPTALDPLVNIIKSVWTDLAPKDNKIHIKLK